MERCPVCRARLDAKTECRRCGTDLSRLILIERQADSLTRRAVARFTTLEPAEAARALEQASRLKTDPLTRALLGFVRKSLGS
jgi:tRNA(Ile2) C34 agmatinyltransferase TiaS